MEEKNKFNYRINDLYRGNSYKDSYYYDYDYDEKITIKDSSISIQDMADIFGRYFSEDVKRAKLEKFKRWVVDPASNELPENLTFGEIHATLDNIEERLAQLRDQFSHEKFKKD